MELKELKNTKTNQSNRIQYGENCINNTEEKLVVINHNVVAKEKRIDENVRFLMENRKRNTSELQECQKVSKE